jgi:ribosomal protein L7/L12
MTQVEVTGWKPGFKSISFIKLIRSVGLTRWSLQEAKDLVDAMIAGNPFPVQFTDGPDASEFVRAAEALGAITSITEASEIGDDIAMGGREC